MGGVQCKLWYESLRQVRSEEWNGKLRGLDLLAAHIGKGAKVDRCQEHMVADGEIERSIKKDGLVERTRRCGECGGLFKTTEIADNMMADIEDEHNAMVVELKRELNYYREIVKRFKELLDLENMLKNEMQRDYGLGKEGGD